MLTAIFKEAREIFLGSDSIPAGEQVEIHYYSPDREVVNLLLMDALGTIQFQTEKTCKEGMSHFQIPTEGWNSGTYKVSVMCASACVSKKIALR